MDFKLFNMCKKFTLYRLHIWFLSQALLHNFIPTGFKIKHSAPTPCSSTAEFANKHNFIWDQHVSFFSFSPQNLLISINTFWTI